VWRTGHRQPAWSGGHYSGHRHRIVVTAGARAPQWEQQHVLAHELAHALTRWADSHGDRFWLQAWTLYRHYRLPLDKVGDREWRYVRGSARGKSATSPRHAASLVGQPGAPWVPTRRNGQATGPRPKALAAATSE
jgi:hypothetical protein